MSTKHTRVLLRVALGAILLTVATHTRADQDLFGNVRFGGDVVAARSAVLPDLYSFTSAGVFMNHEWLFEAIAYLAFDRFGTTGLIALKLSLLAAMIAAVVGALRAAGVEGQDGDLLVGLTLVATFPQTNQVRAQLFSLALFACVLLVLLIARKRPASLAWLVPIMTLWPNVHGGWIVAAGALGVWSGIGLLTSRFSKRAWIVAAASTIALAATMINPWGWHMWTFLYEKVDFGRADIADWQPVFVIGPAYGALWLIVLTAAIAGAILQLRRRALDLQSTAVVLMFCVASFRVNRLLAFFALSTVMLFGPELIAWRARVRAGRPEPVPSRLAGGLAAATALAVILFAATVSARNASCIRMETPTFAEPELTAFVQQHQLHGRMLTYFDYGHYAIWYFTPAIKISMDPRREAMYSDEMIQRHLRFYFVPETRQATIDALQPDYIWLPTPLPVTSVLIKDGWKPLFKGPQSTLLAKSANLNPVNPVNPVNTTNPGSRCFPGP